MENLGCTDATKPLLLLRSRDIDTNVRKSFYSKVLSTDELPLSSLSLEERESLLTLGLNDRESVVVKACGKIVSEKWIRESGNNLVAFLAQFDVVSRPEVAEVAIKAFLQANPKFEPPGDGW